MTEQVAVNGQTKPRVNLVELVRSFIWDYKGFLRTYLKEAKPPFLVLMIWFLGVAAMLDRIEAQYLFQSRYQIQSWATVWLVVLLFGIISGGIAYLVAGAWYHMRVVMSGGSRDRRVSRYLYLYTKFPIVVVSLLSAVFSTLAYGDDYFTEPTSTIVDLVWLGIAVVVIGYSVSLSYRGVRFLQETKPARSMIFFVILPALFYAAMFGGVAYMGYSKGSRVIALNEQALQAMIAGDYGEAERLFRQALSKTSKDDTENIITINQNLALVYVYQEDTGKAKECYDEVLSLQMPESSGYSSTLGKRSVLQGEIHTAIVHFEKALELDPNDFDAHNGLGLIYMGFEQEEFEDYERALPHNEKAHSLIGDATTMENLALNYFFLERMSDALPLFETLDRDIPDNALAKYFLGLICYRHGDLAKAVELLQQAVMLNPALFNEEVEEIIREASKQGGTS